MNDFANRIDVLAEIDEERQRQDKQWGGPEHDDEHNEFDWCHFILERLTTAKVEVEYHQKPNVVHLVKPDLSVYREKMIQIAALAIAAIESHDRKNKNVDD